MKITELTNILLQAYDTVGDVEVEIVETTTGEVRTVESAVYHDNALELKTLSYGAKKFWTLSDITPQEAEAIRSYLDEIINLTS